MSSPASSLATNIQGHGLLALTFSLLAIAIIVVGLRLYVRLVMKKNFGLDDVFIVLTLGLLAAGDACLWHLVNDGVGRHLKDLPNPLVSALDTLKWNTIYQAINVIGALFTKVSIGLFILRISSTRRLTLAIWMVLTPLAIATVILVFIVLLQCIPLHKLWEPTVAGHCISAQIPLNMSYVQSAFAIIADIFLTLSPVAVLWNVKISLNKKLAICGLMSLGLIATVANAIRNVFIPSLTEDDLTYTILPIVMVADLEFSLGAIAACIPTLVPLFTQFKTKENKTYSKMSRPHSQTGLRSSQMPGNDLEMNDGYTITDVRYEPPSESFTSHPMDQKIKIPFSRTWTVEHSKA